MDEASASCLVAAMVAALDADLPVYALVAGYEQGKLVTHAWMENGLVKLARNDGKTMLLAPHALNGAVIG